MFGVLGCGLVFVSNFPYMQTVCSLDVQACIQCVLASTYPGIEVFSIQTLVYDTSIIIEFFPTIVQVATPDFWIEIGFDPILRRLVFLTILAEYETCSGLLAQPVIIIRRVSMTAILIVTSSCQAIFA